jgi:hypothetical protein
MWLGMRTTCFKHAWPIARRRRPRDPCGAISLVDPCINRLVDGAGDRTLLVGRGDPNVNSVGCLLIACHPSRPPG